jgi:tetratricopeptide (TPR) repeat protein
MEQIPLFHDSHLLANAADTSLAALRLDEAITRYQTYAELYGEDERTSHKRKLAKDLKEGLNRLLRGEGPCPDDFCALWESVFEKAQARGLDKSSLLPVIRQSFFRLASDVLKRRDPDHFRGVGIRFPLGYILMMAGDLKEAIQDLRSQIARDPENARLCGYLGDAFYRSGNIHAASRCYFDACLIDPAALDWRHLQNRELISLQEELSDDRDRPETDRVAWVAVVACLRGIISPHPIDRPQKFTALVERYLDMEKTFIQTHDPRTAARLFLIGMVLCGHEPLLRHIKGVDLASIRTRMKDVNASLFEQYLQTVERRWENPRKRP